MPQGTDQSILIIDDQITNNVLLERILESAGYKNVVSTTDPWRAADLFAEIRPDLVLLDLTMPGLDGFGVLESLRSLIDEDHYVPILILTGETAANVKHRALSAGAKDFLTKPVDRVEVVARVRNLLETRSLHMSLVNHNRSLETIVRERTKDLQDAVHDLMDSQSELQTAQRETVARLSLAAEFRDDDTARHIKRMGRYCELLAERAGIGGERETIALAAQLHDVGKIAIPDRILLKPGKLTAEERTVMEKHTLVGHEMLTGSKSELLDTAAVIALTHHEKVDGSGYPHGLKGDRIPMEGRLAAIADVFDALTSDRVYRKAFSVKDALRVMREGRGNHFDAELLDLFLDDMDDVLQIKEQNADVPGREPGSLWYLGAARDASG